MLGWDSGYVDYATTTYWYGDYNAEALGTSGIAEARHQLLQAPPNPANYKIENSIEFEELKHSAKSRNLRIDVQNMQEFSTEKWSRAKQFICTNGKVGDFIEFTFDNMGEGKYNLVLFATKANDYGKLKFYINDNPLNITYDGYSDKVANSKAINLGKFSSISGKIKFKAEIVGTNEKSRGAKYLMGFDCMQITPAK